LKCRRVVSAYHELVIFCNQEIDAFGFFDGSKMCMFEMDDLGRDSRKINTPYNLKIISFHVDLKQIDFGDIMLFQQR
jgi:hypothetical protein